MYFSHLLIWQCEWKTRSTYHGNHLTILPPPPPSVSICYIYYLIFKPHYYAGWPAYQTGVKVIFSSWKMTNCLWKVLEFVFDEAVRTLNVVLKERWHFALLWPMALEIASLTNLCVSRKATPFIQRNEKIGPTSTPLDKEENTESIQLFVCFS